jgi:hypothetical protein
MAEDLFGNFRENARKERCFQKAILIKKISPYKQLIQ